MAHTDGRPMCRHCQARVVTRPRGLCWSCYYRPGVADLYPSTSIYGRRGVGHVGACGEDTTTEAPGGSAEKIAVLARRAERGVPLFQAGDSLRVCDAPRDMRAAARERISAQTVRRVRELRRLGGRVKEIARDLGLSPHTVTGIVRGRHYGRTA